MLLPAELVATTENVYARPVSRSVTVHVAVLLTQVLLPGVEVTVYEEIGDWPRSMGVAHDTTALVPDATALRLHGADGGTKLITARLAPISELPSPKSLVLP